MQFISTDLDKFLKCAARMCMVQWIEQVLRSVKRSLEKILKAANNDSSVRAAHTQNDS
jgi:hypothetical protein